MKSRSAEKIKLTSIDELLGVVNEESAMEIDISKIHAFKDHPFKVLDDEKMTDLVESVKAKGILTPVLLRSDGEDGYEMISGHRRMYAAIRAGLETIPAIVRELSDDDAVIAMVDANIQREELLPSEKAFAYKMKLDAMKRQAGRPSKNSAQIGRNFDGKEDSSCPFVTQYDMWREVAYFAKYVGVSNAFALHTATQVNAELLGLGGETGTIECGKAADILVTRKNPLDDLCALREPTHVMCRGDLVRKLKVKRIPEVDAELDAIMAMPAEALAEELARDGVA